MKSKIKEKGSKKEKVLYSGDMPYVGFSVAYRIDVVVPPIMDTFELPSREELLAVKPGDVVKLMFAQKGRPIERMWVKVTSVMDGTEWTGMLDNDPLAIELAPGTALSFHPLAVIQVEPNKKRPGGNLSC